MGEGSERAMRGARSRRLAVAGLLALSVFSCSYGDREDKEEDDKAKRAGLVLPSPGFARAAAPGTVPG